MFYLVIFQERRSLAEVGLVEKMYLREIRYVSEYPIGNLALSEEGGVACCCEYGNELCLFLQGFLE